LLLQEWNDFNLAWNATEYGGISSVRIPPKLIWKPDILLYNRLHIIVITDFSTPLPFNASGEVIFLKWEN